MNRNWRTEDVFDPDEATTFGDLFDEGLALNRRSFLQVLGVGLLITVAPEGVDAQQRGRGNGSMPVAARLHINPDGTITVLTGKVEEGQGARGELSQAAAEELRVPLDRIRMIMADTDLVPDDGITAGSRTTPINVPAVRTGAATARELLVQLAAKRWDAAPETLAVRDGVITHAGTGRTLSYGDLAQSAETTEAFQQPVRDDVQVTALTGWSVMGRPTPRPNGRDIVTGTHRYPSDIVRPGMLYGAVLRPPTYRTTLASIDLSAAEKLPDVVVVREGEFVGLAAPSTFAARRALRAVAATATWKMEPHVSSREVYAHLKQHADASGRGPTTGDADAAFAGAATVLEQTYHLAYAAHAPMECRAAVAEWSDGRLTVWTGTDNPFRARGEVAGALGVPADRVRLIVPDMGGGFGGKHTGEAAEEAARLARAAKRPVAVQWTRAEEFAWAYVRPAAVIECKAALDDQGTLTAWAFTNINAGGSGIDTPYRIPNTRIQSKGSDSPLRQGSYRCLASTGNNFARESFMDELAAAAGTDPLAFRLAHLDHPRLRRVLDAAAKRFGWAERRKAVSPERGVGLACGTEKNSVVAACVEIAIDRTTGEVRVIEVCEAFECGPIINPANLLSQVQGCICMGLGPALREAMAFENGRLDTDGFDTYQVPRFQDVPKLNIELVENRDIPPAGGGETPIIAVAPAIANAVFAATGIRLRAMPLETRPHP